MTLADSLPSDVCTYCGAAVYNEPWEIVLRYHPSRNGGRGIARDSEHARSLMRLMKEGPMNREASANQDEGR
jgi:hypothetical protein